MRAPPLCCLILGITSALPVGSALAQVPADIKSDPLFEQDVILPDPSIMKRAEAIQLARTSAGLIQSAGYSCKTISAVRPMIFANGWVIICDRFRYQYEFRDLGGHIELSIDGRVIATH